MCIKIYKSIFIDPLKNKKDLQDSVTQSHLSLKMAMEGMENEESSYNLLDLKERFE